MAIDLENHMNLQHQIEQSARRVLPGWDLDILESRSVDGMLRNACILRARDGNGRCLVEEIDLRGVDVGPAEMMQRVRDALARLERHDRPAAAYVKA